MDSGIAYAALYAARIRDLRPAEADHHGGDVIRRDSQDRPDSGVFRKWNQNRTKSAGRTEQLKICSSSHLIKFGIKFPGGRMRHQKTGCIAEKRGNFRGKILPDADHLISAVDECKLYRLPVPVVWCIGKQVDEKPDHSRVYLPVEESSMGASVQYKRIQHIRSIFAGYRVAAVFGVTAEDLYCPARADGQTVLTPPAGMILIRCSPTAMILFIEIQQLPGTDLDATAASDAELVIYFKFCNIDHSLKNRQCGHSAAGTFDYSTVTDFARFLGLSISQPLCSAT